jgi:hypothetical protein
LLQKAFWKNCNVGDTYSSVGYDFQGPCVPGNRCEARGNRTHGGFSNIAPPGRSNSIQKMRTKISKKIFRPAPAAASNERRSNPSITIGDDQSDYQNDWRRSPP